MEIAATRFTPHHPTHDDLHYSTTAQRDIVYISPCSLRRTLMNVYSNRHFHPRPLNKATTTPSSSAQPRDTAAGMANNYAVIKILNSSSPSSTFTSRHSCLRGTTRNSINKQASAGLPLHPVA